MIRARHGAAAAALALLLSGAVWAQTAGEIAAPDYEPPRQRLTGSLVFSGEPGLEAPPGAENLSVELADVSIEGALPGTQALVGRIRARLTRGRIPVSEIFAAASDLEAGFADAGYVLSRVVLPAQTLVDGGRLRLSVVNGFVERIDDSAAPVAVRRRLERLTRNLVGRPGIKLSQIERRLLLAGDTYGVALGSALAAGAQPGGTVIVLQPQFRKVTGFAGFDNGFSEALGTWSASAGVELNGFFGRGEVIYGRIAGHPSFGEGGFFTSDPKLRTLAAGVVFPIGFDGLTFNLEASQSLTRPQSAGGESTSRFDRVSLRLFYPWIRSGKTNVSTRISFDAQNDRQSLVTAGGPVPLYEDRLRVLRFAADGFWILGSGALEAGAIASLGIDGLGARNAASATPALPLSRDGADADFRKLELSFRYRRQIGDRFAFSISGRGQTAFGDALPSSEQMGIGSLQELSAFDQGSLSGDSGWVLRGEVSVPLEREVAGRPLRISPYLFAATGSVSRARPSVDETARTDASAYGIGVEVVAVRDPKFSSASVRLEYAKGTRNDGGKDGSRLSLLGSLRF